MGQDDYRISGSGHFLLSLKPIYSGGTVVSIQKAPAA